jgi:hypothetical protein
VVWGKGTYSIIFPSSLALSRHKKHGFFVKVFAGANKLVVDSIASLESSAVDDFFIIIPINGVDRCTHEYESVW